MPISWFQLLKCEGLLLSLILYNCEKIIVIMDKYNLDCGLLFKPVEPTQTKLRVK